MSVTVISPSTHLKM